MRAMSVFVLLLIWITSCFADQTCVIPDRVGKKLFMLHDYDDVSDEGGVLATIPLEIPAYEKVNYISGAFNQWPGNHNRLLSWVAGEDITKLFEKEHRQDPTVDSPVEREGMFALFKLKSGNYLSLTPVTTSKTMGWLFVDKTGAIQVRVGTLGTERTAGEVPAVAWAVAENIYDSCYQAWETAVSCPEVNGLTQLRYKKHYNEPFRYLGWCSWEQYKKQIDEATLLNAIDNIEASGLPVRWFLVDDGHQESQGNRLVSFEPSPKKFPNGWKPVLARRDESRIKWFGLWHCFYGLWGGIAKDNKLGELNQHLRPQNHQSLLVKGDKTSAQEFFGRMIKTVEKQGFDFVKIDVQSLALRKYQGTANAVQAYSHLSQAMERACYGRMDGLINCMAHNQVCVFNTRYSSVTRCSADYVVGNEAKTKTHLQQSYNNTLWMGQTIWPDHDMFHSSDRYCGRMMAVSKALSAGPIYLSDDPKTFREDFIRPLCYEDGELLRPLAPAVPLPESLFVDAYNEDQSYRVIAPLPHQTAAVAIYNLRHPTTDNPVATLLTPGDYQAGSAMIQPWPGPWTSPAEGLVAFDWYEQRGDRLRSGYEVALKGFMDKLFLLCPVQNDWAVVGRTDKYLSTVAVERYYAEENHLQITLHESGPLVFWNGHGKPTCLKGELIPMDNGFWKLDLPVGERNYYVMIERNS